MSWYYSEKKIEKLNLTWDKQTNFNKLGPLPRIFLIVLMGRGMGNLSRGVFYRVAKIWQGVIVAAQTFFKAKKTFCKYWTLLKSKLACPVYAKSMKVR